MGFPLGRSTAALLIAAVGSLIVVTIGASVANNGSGWRTGLRAADQIVASASPPSGVEVRIVADGLHTPWDIAFTPDGRMFFTERPGRVRVVESGRLCDESVIDLPATETAEGGAMGLAVNPGFPEEPYLYVMYTYSAGGDLLNRVVRLRLDGSSASEDGTVVDRIPGGQIHNGGRIAFGPDGMLYVTTGDAGEPAISQDLDSLGGKILRLNRDGSIPEDNPFSGSPVYSYGHRNPQGLDWQPGTDRLYSTEHGPVGNDEVNLIEPGENYGWPIVQGEDHGEFTAAIAVYTPAIATSGAAFYDGGEVPEWQVRFFFATLRGGHLRRLELAPNDARSFSRQERIYEGEYGRLRHVVQGPDGALYVATSNRDGRGSPAPGDDRILRVGPASEQALLYPDLKTMPLEDLHYRRGYCRGAEPSRTAFC